MSLYKLTDKGAILLFFIIAMLWLAYLLNVPFHEDEAIYAAWSLTLLKGDVWFSQTLIDKPPLTFYPMALSVGLFGRYEWAARLPNLLWAALLLISCWRIATYYRSSGRQVVFFMLLSPLLWAQTASAFTDLAMLALVFFALERTVKGQIQRAGGLFGLACLAKPTAILLLPLIVGSLIKKRYRKTEIATTLSELITGLALPLLFAWAWDASRSAPSWWALGTQAYGTLGKFNFKQLGEWLSIFLFSQGFLLFFWLIGCLSGWRRVEVFADMKLERQRMSLILVITSILWVPAHLLLGFQPWERYLLPLVPMMALFLAFCYSSIHQDLIGKSGLKSLLASLFQHKHVTIICMVMLLCVPFFIKKFKIEPHDGRWEGIREIGAIIERLPDDATIYYFDTGRPLAWYAANVKATLVWVKPDFYFSSLEANKPFYLVMRITRPLPITLTNRAISLVNKSGNFHILKINSK